MTALASQRSAAYANFAAAFAFPDAEALTAIRSGYLVDFFHRLLAGRQDPLAAAVDWRALAGERIDLDGLQEEFTRLFEVEAAGPPCPLLESHYRGAELANLEELVRYYDFFGLSLPDDRQVRPDHLGTQLEFLHFLSFNEAQSGDDPEAAAALSRAQRDFIERHTGAWIPLLGRALEAQDACPFFFELTRLLEHFLMAEMQRHGEQVETT